MAPSAQEENTVLGHPLRNYLLQRSFWIAALADGAGCHVWAGSQWCVRIYVSGHCTVYCQIPQYTTVGQQRQMRQSGMCWCAVPVLYTFPCEWILPLFRLPVSLSLISNFVRDIAQSCSGSVSSTWHCLFRSEYTCRRHSDPRHHITCAVPAVARSRSYLPDVFHRSSRTMACQPCSNLQSSLAGHQLR